AVQVRRSDHQCEAAVQEVLRVGGGQLVLWDAVVVAEARLHVGASLQAGGVDPVHLQFGQDVAVVPAAIEVVPEDLRRRSGILLVDRGEGEANDAGGLRGD